MMDNEIKSNISFSISHGSFVGTRDRLALCGISGRNKYCLQVLDMLENDEGLFEPLQVFSETFQGKCTDLAVCGDRNKAKVYLAIASMETNSNSINNDSATVSFLDLESSISGKEMDLPGFTVPSTYVFSSLTFSSDQMILAAASEAGGITLRDLSRLENTNSNSNSNSNSNFNNSNDNSNMLICDRIDPCGINDIEFNRSGMIVVAGRSTKDGPTVWDFRQSPNRGPSIKLNRNASLSSNIYNNYNGHNTTLSCIRPHPTCDIVYAGTEEGVVQKWDLRAPGSMCSAALAHTDVTTGLVMHPHPSVVDGVVSSSLDGSVREVFFGGSDVDATMAMENNAANLNSINTNVMVAPKALISEAGAVNQLDLHADSRSILAVGALGTLTVKELGANTY